MYFQGRSQRQPRGTARRIEVKSRCFDACLVIDGSLSFNFNDGTKAIIEILDEDALRDGVDGSGFSSRLPDGKI